MAEPKTVDDINAEIQRLEALKIELARKEEQERMIANHGLAVEIIERMVKDLWKLDEIGYLPPRLKEGLADTNGKFNPGMYIKKPKAPR